MSRYAHIMERAEELLRQVPLDQLRQDVIFAESKVGKLQLPALPSGRTFDQHTRRARLWLDFIDDLRKQEAEEKEEVPA